LAEFSAPGFPLARERTEIVTLAGTNLNSSRSSAPGLVWTASGISSLNEHGAIQSEFAFLSLFGFLAPLYVLRAARDFALSSALCLYGRSDCLNSYVVILLSEVAFAPSLAFSFLSFDRHGDALPLWRPSGGRPRGAGTAVTYCYIEHSSRDRVSIRRQWMIGALQHTCLTKPLSDRRAIASLNGVIVE